jgi:hypothetical protein
MLWPNAEFRNQHYGHCSLGIVCLPELIAGSIAIRSSKVTAVLEEREGSLTSASPVTPNVWSASACRTFTASSPNWPGSCPGDSNSIHSTLSGYRFGQVAAIGADMEQGSGVDWMCSYQRCSAP